MESFGADSAAAAAARWEGETAGGYPSSAEWGVMDLGDGGAVAGVAEQVSSLPDLPSPVPAVGAFGSVGEGLAEAGETVAGRGSVEFGRSLHRRDRRHPTQDGRPLRRYRRRWTVERFFAWLQWFRRLVTRYEYHIENFLGMVRLGCMEIMLRYF